MSRTFRLGLAVVAFWLFFWLALDSLVDDSPTMDEQNHLARGLAYWRAGDPRLSVEHPPLVNALSALPVLTLPNIRLPLDHPSWSQPFGWYEFARLTLWEVNDDVTRMIFLARLPIVFLTMGLALTGYRLAGELFGRQTCLVALGLLLFEPNLIAHGRYTTTDLGGALFFLVATLVLYRLWRRPFSAAALFLAGLALALAWGSKLSTLAFAPVFALLALLPLYGAGARPAGRRLGELIVAALVALPVLWALFLFEWRLLTFQSPALAWLDGRAGPMPTFWAGVEQILLLSDGGRPSFLLGQFSDTGFVAYFPIAFLVKTPLAVLLVLPVAVVHLLRARRHRAAALFLLIPAVAFFALSLTSGLNIGYRHLLPILPLLLVLIAGLGAATSAATAWARRLPLLTLAGLLVATLTIHPHYLSFFNIAAGGPQNGHRILIDSNVDWGQDLLRLRRWVDDNQVDALKLSWFGTAVPARYGLDYEPLPGFPYHLDLWWDLPFDPAGPAPGLYAISVSNLGELPLRDKHVFAYFRAREPDDQIGYSIFIYRVPGD